MDKAKIEYLASRLSHLHRKLKSLKQLKGIYPLNADIDAEIQSELTALQLELRVTPKDEFDKSLFLNLCSDLQTVIIDYVTLREALQNFKPVEVPPVPSPKAIEDIQEVILREKQEEIEELEKDLTQLREIAADLSELVGEQQKPLDEVERQVEVVTVETVKTEIELEEASAYQRSYHRKCCFLWLLVAGACVIAVGLGLVIVGVLVIRQ